MHKIAILRLTCLRFFKNAILTINHQKMKRQLLLKSTINIIIRLTMRKVYDMTNNTISQTLRKLKKDCSKLFHDFLSFSSTSIAIAKMSKKIKKKKQFVENDKHQDSLTHGKKIEDQIKQQDLYLKISKEEFYQHLHKAMLKYDRSTWFLSSKPLHWYQQINFLDS